MDVLHHTERKREMEGMREISRSSEAEKKSSEEMVQLREIAEAHHRAGSPQLQALAEDFFRSMDSDGDGRVDLSEFLAFTTHQGYSYMQTPNFFDQLDLDGNGTLDFSEVITLYYIIRSGRPFCDCCRKFIPGIFFSCVHCFKINPKSSFDLCRDCHREGRCDHNHDGRTHFLDNYTLLQAMITDPPPNLNQIKCQDAFQLALCIANVSYNLCAML